jgi:hypothetical protein
MSFALDYFVVIQWFGQRSGYSTMLSDCWQTCVHIAQQSCIENRSYSLCLLVVFAIGAWSCLFQSWQLLITFGFSWHDWVTVGELRREIPSSRWNHHARVTLQLCVCDSSPSISVFFVLVIQHCEERPCIPSDSSIVRKDRNILRIARDTINKQFFHKEL